jgi:UDP-glucuronate 4-epimerase
VRADAGGFTVAQRVLITGVAGFVGSHLAERLLADGCEVVGIDAFTDYYSTTAKRRNLIPAQRSDTFRLIEGDILGLQLDEVLDGVDTVFHLAGQPGVRKSWGKDFSEYVVANVLATQALLEACTRRELRRFMYASSSSVYGNSQSFPAREDGPTGPMSPYGVTKLAGEHMVSLYAKNLGVPTVSLRYHTVYGPRQRPDMAIHRLFEAALHGDPFPLYSAADNVRDFTFVLDVVEATVAAMSSPLVGSGEVINVSGGASVTMTEVIRLVEQISRRPVPVQTHGKQPGDVERTGGDIGVARELLGWKPQTPIEAGLVAQWDWHRSRSTET